MLTRALIVLLLVLNLGVAAWWLWQPATMTPLVEYDVPSGIARLRLVNEPSAAATHTHDAGRHAPSRDAKGAGSAPPPAQGDRNAVAQAGAAQETSALDNTADAAAAATAETQAARCYRIGPYPDELALTAALPVLRPLASSIRSRETRAGAGRGWRVQIPPAADTQTAKAMAERIRAAGFSDYFVVADGPEAHAIALGRFSNEGRARQHAAALAAAGFPAQAEALGDSKSQYWIDVTATAQATPPALRAAGGGPEVRSTACAAN